MLVECKNVPSDRISSEYEANLSGQQEVLVDEVF